MKKSMTIFAMLVFLAGMVQAQRIVPVAPGIVDNLATVIKADSAARTAALPTQTIYELKRNGTYECVSAIDNLNYFLHIRAESGTGYKPFLIAKENASAKVVCALNFRTNGKLEGLTIEQTTLTGIVGNRLINVYNGSSLWVKDCEIVHDRGSILAILSDSCSVYVEDCFVHSSGHPKSLGGNGRLIDVRPTVIQDSIIVKNTTFFNLTDRIIRNMGTFINYIKFDHNTGFTTQGYHGNFQAGKVKELIITNNIFYNQVAYGSWKSRTTAKTPNISEQTQPENNLMYVLTIDTTYYYPLRKAVVRNNNMFWDQKYVDFWTKYKDSTDVPGKVTPTLMKMLGADSTKAYFTEALTFQAPPPSIYNFIDSAAQFPNSLTLPQNWLYTYQEADGKSPVNGAYPTTAKSYTAGDGGFPLGDLNWFPARKAAWLLTDVKSAVVTAPAAFSLAQNYPNPFNPTTNIAFSLSRTGFASLKVYDMLGREVATLVNEIKEAGIYSVTWNAVGMSSGVYFYKIQAGSFSDMKKMIVIK
ncbi:MAG: T9SS type A sorting domain-containing protein [Ignavibacteriales bacterium]|nr:T9SS type A sorting domain-containing protein [Ignavibacteriales bacterium]